MDLEIGLPGKGARKSGASSRSARRKWRWVITKCKVCHQIGEGAKNSVGPELNGLIGRKTGSVAGYNYSDANKDSGIIWDEGTLNVYLANPKAKIPGTKMIFAGLPKDTDRDNLVAYLAQFGSDGKKK